MAVDADDSRGMQFARDLTEIRRANGISIDDIHNESKIPMNLIEAFEQSGLFDHAMFNRVYLRSFVRTYADVVGISPEIALSSLEAALEGTYSRELAVEYLDYEVPPEPEPEPGDAVIPEPEPAMDTEESPKPPAVRPLPVPPREPEVVREPVKPDPPEAEPVFPVYQGVDRNWTSQSPPPGTPVGARRPDRTVAGKWVLVGVILAVVAAAVWGLVQVTTSGEADPAEPATVVADTTSGELVAAEPVATPVSLGDTMHVTIASADSQLVQGIRVTVDDDLRRPYWLERGDQRTFTPLNRIVIEEQLSQIEVLVEGRSYPVDRIDDQGRLVITRDTALQLLSQP